MNSFVTPPNLWLLRNGPGAPIWRTIVVPETSTIWNLIAAAVVALLFGYIVRMLVTEFTEGVDSDDMSDERPQRPVKYAPWVAALSFLALPPVVIGILQLNPMMFSLVPIFLSVAIVASMNTDFERAIGADGEMLEDRKFVYTRMALAGGAAAVGAWESTLGMVLAPLSLLLGWMPVIRRTRKSTNMALAWIFGFALMFMFEPAILGKATWWSIMPKMFSIPLIAIFLIFSVAPLGIVHKKGDNIRTLGFWMAVVAIMAAVSTALASHYTGKSASERFVRMFIEKLGDRKYVIGDGVFDVMINEFKAPDVKIVGTQTLAEREFLINLFADGAAVTNKLLSILEFYNWGDMREAADEAGMHLPMPSDWGTRHQITDEEQQEQFERFKAVRMKKLEPVGESLFAMGEGYRDIPEEKRKQEIDKARQNIRTGWMNGARGINLSSTLLSLDMMLGDRVALEADAISALIYDVNDPAANAALGSVRLADGKLDDAEKYLKKALGGKGAGTMRDYARVMVMRGNFAEAEKWAREAVKAMPNDWSVAEPLVAALVEQGKMREAEVELREIERKAIQDGKMKTVEPFLQSVRKRMQSERSK